jgi:hypothetical protein
LANIPSYYTQSAEVASSKGVSLDSIVVFSKKDNITLYQGALEADPVRYFTNNYAPSSVIEFVDNSVFERSIKTQLLLFVDTV